MAHKTLVNGTSYDITGGRTLIDGTGYDISKGRTLVSGTGYDIRFLPPVGTPLENFTWEQIDYISASGLGSTYFSVGDRKSVYLSGTAGSLALNGTYDVYIIGFDHNSSIEGMNKIHFQFGFTAGSGGVPICFVDSGYDNAKTSGSWFNMSNASGNSGGWESSRMRNIIIPTFKSCMPSELQNVLKIVTKYSDNTGGGSDIASYVTATLDEIFLLSEYEVYGKRMNANSAEQNYQAQYAYYSAGNAKNRLRHNNTKLKAYWWLRSVDDGKTAYLYVNDEYITSTGTSTYSRGFAPAFCV